MWIFGPLDYKCRITFKFKINRKKLIIGWDVKIEREKNWEDLFSLTCSDFTLKLRNILLYILMSKKQTYVVLFMYFCIKFCILLL
jgi:hypothetical protein